MDNLKTNFVRNLGGENKNSRIFYWQMPLEEGKHLELAIQNRTNERWLTEKSGRTVECERAMSSLGNHQLNSVKFDGQINFKFWFFQKIIDMIENKLTFSFLVSTRSNWRSGHLKANVIVGSPIRANFSLLLVGALSCLLPNDLKSKT